MVRLFRAVHFEILLRKSAEKTRFISKDFISYIRKVIENLLATEVVEQNLQLVLKEAI